MCVHPLIYKAKSLFWDNSHLPAETTFALRSCLPSDVVEAILDFVHVSYSHQIMLVVIIWDNNHHLSTCVV